MNRVLGMKVLQELRGVDSPPFGTRVEIWCWRRRVATTNRFIWRLDACISSCHRIVTGQASEIPHGVRRWGACHSGQHQPLIAQLTKTCRSWGLSLFHLCQQRMDAWMVMKHRYPKQVGLHQVEKVEKVERRRNRIYLWNWSGLECIVWRGVINRRSDRRQTRQALAMRPSATVLRSCGNSVGYMGWRGMDLQVQEDPHGCNAQPHSRPHSSPNHILSRLSRLSSSRRIRILRTLLGHCRIQAERTPDRFQGQDPKGLTPGHEMSTCHPLNSYLPTTWHRIPRIHRGVRARIQQECSRRHLSTSQLWATYDLRSDQMLSPCKVLNGYSSWCLSCKSCTQAERNMEVMNFHVPAGSPEAFDFCRCDQRIRRDISLKFESWTG